MHRYAFYSKGNLTFSDIIKRFQGEERSVSSEAKMILRLLDEQLSKMIANQIVRIRYFLRSFEEIKMDAKFPRFSSLLSPTDLRVKGKIRSKWVTPSHQPNNRIKIDDDIELVRQETR